MFAFLHTSHRWSISTSLSSYFREDQYGLAHVAGREPYDLHHLADAFGVGSIIYVCADRAQHIITAGTGSTVVDDLDHDLSEVPVYQQGYVHSFFPGGIL